MKQKVLIIGGGEVFKSFDDFVEFQKSYDPGDIFDKDKIGWKENLKKDLKEFNVKRLYMPSSDNSKYFLWKFRFDNFLKYINGEELILVGHSLGGIFLLKYLSENEVNFNIKQLHIVGSPYIKDYLLDFNFDEKKVAKLNSNKIFLYHSKDDKIVDVESFYKYKELLTNSKYFLFEDKGHFLEENFDELKENILNY